MNTLFVGHHITFLDCIDSTNNYAAKLINEGHKHEGSVIVADEQTSGRGRDDKKWISQPGENLLMSVILRPHFITAQNTFALNKIAALAVYNTLKSEGVSAMIKWPNDLLTARGKIAGILIETQIRGSQLSSAIVGIGLNMNQAHFSEPGITSMWHESRRVHERQALLKGLCASLEATYLRYKAAPEKVDDAYLAQLYGLNQWLPYRFGPQIEEARLIGLSADGRAHIERRSGVGFYTMDEATLVRNHPA